MQGVNGNTAYRLILAGIVAGAAIAVAVLLFPSSDGTRPAVDAQTQGDGDASLQQTSASRSRMSETMEDARGKSRRRNLVRAVHNIGDTEKQYQKTVPLDMTASEAELQAKIEAVLDTEKLSDAVALLPSAMSCSNKEIRLSMISTLGWFDDKAIPHLVPFLSDADEDVRSEALSAWESAVGMIESDSRKGRLVESAMAILTDPDDLETAANVLVGGDDKVAVETLLRVIGGGSEAAAKAAREAYEMVTGDEYTTPEAAKKWLQEHYVAERDEG